MSAVRVIQQSETLLIIYRRFGADIDVMASFVGDCVRREGDLLYPSSVVIYSGCIRDTPVEIEGGFGWCREGGQRIRLILNPDSIS